MGGIPKSITMVYINPETKEEVDFRTVEWNYLSDGVKMIHTICAVSEISDTLVELTRFIDNAKKLYSSGKYAYFPRAFLQEKLDDMGFIKE
jgi:hypothetical protein